MRSTRSKPWAAGLTAVGVATAAALVFAIGPRDRVVDWFLGRHVGHPAGAGGDVAFYTCSMDPSVEAHAPGKCPICGMDLTPVSEEQRKSDVLHLDMGTVQRIGVRLATVEKRTLRRRIAAFGAVAAPGAHGAAGDRAPTTGSVDAVLHGGDAAAVKEGMAVGAVLPSLPLTRFDGAITLVQPDPAANATRLRVTLADPGQLRRAGQAAEVQIELDLTDRLVVPAESVVYAGRRRVVFVDRKRGSFEPREVTIGVQVGDLVEVVKGLSVGERVASAGTFLLAAESRIRSSSKLWSEERVAAAPAKAAERKAAERKAAERKAAERKPAEAQKGGTP